MKTPIFEFPPASWFVIIFRKRLKAFVKKMTKTKRNTMLMETQNLESSLNEKKIQTKIQKLLHFFTGQQEKNWSVLLQNDFNHLWIFTNKHLEFSVTEKASGRSLVTTHVEALKTMKRKATSFIEWFHASHQRSGLKAKWGRSAQGLVLGPAWKHSTYASQNLLGLS